MAKITDIKFEIKGEPFKVNINCTSSGEFTANIPDKIAEPLGLQRKLSFPKLTDLESAIKSAIERYKNAETSEAIFILLKYGARGKYNEKSDGYFLFGGYNHKYHIEFSFSSNSISALTFDFKVCIRQTVDGVENWFEARQGKNFPHWDEEQRSNPEKYYKQEKCHDAGKWKKIPYSEAALVTLNNAQEKIRMASEVLFNFIEQDEKAIEATLLNQKLLN